MNDSYPRSYTTEPAAFGKAAQIQWIEPSEPSEADRCLAARMQHEYAVRINRRLRELGKTVHDYASMTGTPYDRLTKVLRGVAVMKLEDIAQAERLLGHIVED